LLATGGDDGGIKVWNVAEILAKKNLLQKELSESNVKTVKIPSPPADE
jgi:hypothetical protein